MRAPGESTLTLCLFHIHERDLRPAVSVGAVSGSRKSRQTPGGPEALARAQPVPSPRVLTRPRLASRIHVISRQRCWPDSFGAYFQFQRVRRLEDCSGECPVRRGCGAWQGERHQEILGANAKRSGEEGMPLSVSWVTGRTAG